MAQKAKATSSELTGGAGFTYEDMVVAYYLVALLREGHAAGQGGVVTTVAVQQSGAGHPMDDLVVEFKDGAGPRVLALQVKQSLRITANNEDFHDIMAKAVATRTATAFNETYRYGFATEHVAQSPFRAIGRITDWARASPDPEDFERRFAAEGAAAITERNLRLELTPLTGAATIAEEARFYRQFVPLKMEGLDEGGALRAELVNRLQEIVAENEDGQDILLFDRLCRLARDAAGTARKWTRATLLGQLRGVVRLRVAPNYSPDIEALASFSSEGLADITETIDDFHVRRSAFQDTVRERLASNRLVNISGLPGCGKSVVLKHFAADLGRKGPILFLKSDRLVGNGWSSFATALQLHHALPELLIEIGTAGEPILFIDGIDRIRPDQKGIITDILRTIEGNEDLAHWKVVASSRDQGLEPYRAWFPSSFYRGSGIGDAVVGYFSDEEAEMLAERKPHLRRLLFGGGAIQEIARRPFFAAVLARGLADDETTPQTEIDLIAAWWARAGHDALPETAPQRQRALLDLAESGVRDLGKNVAARRLKDSTFAHISALKSDHLIREQNGGAAFSFTHDIFFEWAFFRLLTELGDDWHQALSEAGEPPLLGRIVGLLAQSRLSDEGAWRAGYRNLEGKPLRPQWRREWLTAPPFTSLFSSGSEEFYQLLSENDFALFEKVMVWFQAQHTIPSPIVLRGLHNPVEGTDNVRLADMLGWPSDFQSWGRLLDWLLPIAPSLPARLVPHVIEIFGVWQNALADVPNKRSAAVIRQCGEWLINLEETEYFDPRIDRRDAWQGLGGKARSSLATALRGVLLRAARAYSEPAIALFERAVANERMRKAAYSDLMAFTPIMAEVAPTNVVALAKAELMEELPQSRFDRFRREAEERRARLEQIRAIPEADRTPHQRRALEFVHFPASMDRYDLDDVGIQRHNNFYFPASALHEPFASLFAKAPESALQLVHDLSNHTTTGWRQIHGLNHHEMGTPLPVTLEFPWGEQTFWGDWRVYSWFLGELAPQPLECAFLALSYWAFKEIERGRPTSDVIKAVVEGSECYASLGLALVLALETWEVSEVTLPIASCQKLWHHDIARLAHEPTRNIDLFGMAFLSRLSGDKARAKDFLDQRKSRKREVRELASLFALSSDKALRDRFKAALAEFPVDLPYELEEQQSNPTANADFLEKAHAWAGLGDIKNYRQSPAGDDQVMITYERPVPLTEAQEQRAADAATYLNEQGAFTWAAKSLSENKVAGGWALASAIEFAKARDSETMFDVRQDVGPHAAQSAVSAIAACAIRFHANAPDREWAWNVMSRVERMQEPGGYSGSKIPWHPAIHLTVALVQDRRSNAPRRDSAERLLRLTVHPLDDISQLAFQGLFMDANDHVPWVAAQFAMELSIYRHPKFRKNGKPDNSAGTRARDDGLSRAIASLSNDTPVAFLDLPRAWAKASHVRRRVVIDGVEDGWGESDPSFNSQFAAKIFASFPVETWCQSPIYRPLWQMALSSLVTWTAERLMPPWHDGSTRRDGSIEPFEWDATLGDLLARSAPFFDTSWVRQRLLTPFLADDENALRILAEFTDRSIARHILDADQVPDNTLELLGDCADRVVRDRMFDPKGYRAGEVHGSDMPELIKALLLVAVEHAPRAARFVNGDWSQIGLAMPIITRLVAAIGWSPFVMQNFLMLCERAGLAYPLDEFSHQMHAVLAALPNAKGSWAGTLLPARIAGVVQRLADGNYPLTPDQALQLLEVLDALIDLGDRRSAALEQTEAFRGVQVRA